MHKLYFSKKLPIDLETAWDFFSSPLNLEKITPSHLALKIQEDQTLKAMYTGQIITYTVSPFWNLKWEWVTEIMATQKPHYFIDEQKFGPYTFWHHEHWFTSIEGGVLMEDIIYYKLPLGFLGKILHHYKVKGDLEKIFAYRSQALDKILCRNHVH